MIDVLPRATLDVVEFFYGHDFASCDCEYNVSNRLVAMDREHQNLQYPA
jgi:hypothetical protein